MFDVRIPKTFQTIPLLITVLFISIPALAQYSGGNGMAENPYQISTVTDWQTLMNTPSDWNRHFILTADIDLNGASLSPVGISSSQPFTGLFHGKNHKIQNAVLRLPDSKHVGLFGFVDPNGHIRNVGAVDVTVIGDNYVGGLVGTSHGTIEDCYTTGNISGVRRVGGLVGQHAGITFRCNTSTTVTGTYEEVGGLLGINFGEIVRSSATGNVTGTGHNIGGLVGVNGGEGVISECSAASKVTGDEIDIGGLVGFNWGTIQNCRTTGEVIGGHSAGGLVGSNSGTISRCYAGGSVSGGDRTGGLLGVNFSELKECYATASVTGASPVAGLVGENQGDIINCYAIGDVTGENWVASLVGFNWKNVSNCFAAGHVQWSHSTGGLISFIGDDGAVSDSFWDTRTTGQSSSSGGIGKNTEQMQTASAFTSAGWDFTNIWTIDEGMSYPYFRFAIIEEPISDINLYKVIPEYHSNAVDITLTVTGDGFNPQVSIELVDGNFVAYMADNVEYISTTEVEATFTANTIPTGIYSLRMLQEHDHAFLLDAFEVLEGGSSHLVTSLELPDSLDYDGLGTIYVEYKNDGEITMPAPLLHLAVTQNDKQAAILTLDSELVTQGLETSTMPEGFSDSIQFLADGNSPGRLHPGESRRIPIFWVGWLQPWDLSYPDVYFSLGVLTVDEDKTINYDQMEQAIQPEDIEASTWSAIWTNFTTQTGTTWGDYVRMLDENAIYLGRINRDITDISELLTFEFAQANALNIIPYLSRSTDARVEAPGLDIVFERAFLPSITSRHLISPFGRGWYHNWDISLIVKEDDTVTIEGPFGSHRVFQPDGISGYSSRVGDYGQLVVRITGEYELTKTNGVRYVFSVEGLLSYVVDTNGNRITAGYTNGLLSSLTHSSGQWLQLAYNSVGMITSITESSGLQTIYSYDTDNEHLMTAELPDGTTVSYAYNTDSNPALEHSLAHIEYPGSIHQFFTYDAQGRLEATYKDDDKERLTITYDSAGTIALTDASDSTTQYFLDNRNLMGKIVDPLGNAIYVGHNGDYNLTELTDTEGNTNTYGYDQQGNLTQWTDPLGNITQFEYSNIYNRMTRLIDANLNQTRYKYDTKGNLNSIIYEDGTVESWTYDGLGNAAAWSNRRGSQITYQYNTAGQITAKSYPMQKPISYEYDAHGNLTSYTDSIGTTELIYDAHDRLERIIYPGNRYLEYSYDTAGRRATCTDQLGNILTYSYDSVGHLESITDTAKGNIVSYQYDDTGRLSMKTLGNGVYTTYSYDAAGQILSLVNYGPDDKVLSRFDYEYDNLVQRISMTTLFGTWSYEYDDLGQLTAWTDPDGRHVEYVYDALGNRDMVVDDSVSTDYTANNMNQYTQDGDTTYTYDADGNMQSKTDSEGTTTYGYDDENRLIRVVIPSDDVWDYIYDGVGNRVAVIENGIETQYVHDPIGFIDVVGKYTDNGDLTTRYIYGYGLASYIASSAEVGYYSFDALGSTSEITDDTGQAINSYLYDPFGISLHSYETVPNAFRFVGEYGVMHEGSGLAFMRARFYDSSTGRFTAMDPIGLRGGDLNLYRYVHNQPTNIIDPEGTNPYLIAAEVVDYGMGLMGLDAGPYGFGTGIGGMFGKATRRNLENKNIPEFIEAAYGFVEAWWDWQKEKNKPRLPYEPSGATREWPFGWRPTRPIPPTGQDDQGGSVPIGESEPGFILTVNSSGWGVSEVSIGSSTGHGGTTNYTMTVPSGTTVTLTAPKTIPVPLIGDLPFAYWTGSVNSFDQIISFSMDGNKTVTAEYMLDGGGEFD